MNFHSLYELITCIHEFTKSSKQKNVNFSHCQAVCIYHLLRDINSQIHEYFLNQIWRYYHFDVPVKCILLPFQDLKKGWMISTQEKTISK